MLRWWAVQKKRSYCWLGNGQCMVIQGSWKVLKYPKLFMPMCTLKTIICYLCVYTLNGIVFMLAEVPLCPEVCHFDLSQHASVSSGEGFDNPKWREVVTFNLKMRKGARAKQHYTGMYKFWDRSIAGLCWDNPEVTAPSSDRGAVALSIPKAVLCCPVEAVTSSALLTGGGGAPRSHLSYEDNLRESTLEKRRLLRDFIAPSST